LKRVPSIHELCLEACSIDLPKKNGTNNQKQCPSVSRAKSKESFLWESVANLDGAGIDLVILRLELILIPIPSAKTRLTAFAKL